MKGKTLISLAIVLAMILAAMPFAVTVANPCTIKVVFPANGLSTITERPGSTFNADINIYNSPNIGYYDMGIQWNATMLELTGNTIASVVEGDFMKAFGSTLFPGPSASGTDLAAGIMSDIPCGFLSGGPAHGNGTMFTISFTALAAGTMPAYIDIMEPNVTSYLLDPTLTVLVPIQATVNGSVTVQMPPAALSVAVSPATVTMDVGQSQNFTSTVSGGTPPYTYQWYQNGTAVSGATGSSYTFTPSSRGHYNFYLNVTDSAKARAESNTATAVVNPALSVSISPTTVTMDVGQSRLFNSTVSGGTSPFSYQWCLNGSVISGATSSSYTFTPSSRGHYNFFLNVTDHIGMKVQSNTATTTVNVAPPVTYSVSFSESGLTSETSWNVTFNGTTFSSSSSTITFTGVKNGSYSYTVGSVPGYTASPSKGSVTVNGANASVQIRFTTKAALSVAVSPATVTMDVGQSQNFTSTVSGGTSPYTYQWYQNGTAVSGATGSSYTFTPSSRGHYNFYLNVTDSAKARAESNTATAVVNPALSVSISPTTVTMDVGQSQPFTSTPSGGTSPFSYQWYLDDVAVSGATGSSWIYTPSAAGPHTVYVKVTDSALTHVTATSNTASVTVNGLPTVSISPTSATMHVGDTVQFTSTPSGGTPPYAYQWYLNNASVSGATSSSWAFTPSSAGSYNVYLNITDSVGVRAKSNIAPVTVIPVLTVTISPTLASITIGQSVLFTSTVSVAPYYYQWYLNGTAVLGAKNSTWTFLPTSMGTYNIYLTVTDSSGTTTKSNVVQVTVTISALYLVLPFFMISTLLGSFLIILLAMFPLKKKRRRIN